MDRSRSRSPPPTNVSVIAATSLWKMCLEHLKQQLELAEGIEDLAEAAFQMTGWGGHLGSIVRDTRFHGKEGT